MREGVAGPEKKDVRAPPLQLPVHPHLCRPWYQDSPDILTMNQTFNVPPSK